MKPKISREEFLKLKDKIIELINQLEEYDKKEVPGLDKNTENYSQLANEYREELLKEWMIKYKETIEELTSFDLSEISFEDWNGITIYAYKEEISGMIISADFSETYANLDFSNIEFIGDNFDFHSCKILNLNDSDIEISKEIFDEDVIDTNSDFFTSEELPKDVKERFYSKRLTLNDIITYEEIFLKSKKHMGYPYNTEQFEKIIDNITYEELKKIDYELLKIIDFKLSKQDIKEITKEEKITAEIFNKVLNNRIREEAISGWRITNNGVYPESFRKNNPDILYYEEIPELFQTPTILKNIDLKLMYEFKDVLKGKKYQKDFKMTKLAEMLGDEIIEILPEEFKIKQAEKLIQFFVPLLSSVKLERDEKADKISKKLLDLPIEERVQLLKKLCENDFGKTENLKEALELSKIMDISDMNFGKMDSKIKEFGLEKFVNAGYTTVSEVKEISETRQLKEIKEYIENIGIEVDFFRHPGDDSTIDAIKKYGIDFYIQEGCDSIPYIQQYRMVGVLLDKAKELIDQGVDLGASFDDEKIVNFINVLGIDNIIKFHEENEDFFYYTFDIYNKNLGNFAKIFSENNETNKINNNISYEEFIQEIVKIVSYARKNRISIDDIKKMPESVKKVIPKEFLDVEELEDLFPFNPERTK